MVQAQDEAALPEVSIHGEARLFVASYPLHDAPVSGIFRSMFYGLAWLSGGAATFVRDHERFAVEAETLVWTVPGQVHFWEHPEPHASVILIGFVSELLVGSALNIHLIQNLPFFAPNGQTILAASAEGGEALTKMFQHLWQRYVQVAFHDPAHPWLTLPPEREGMMVAHLHAILAEAALLDPATSPGASRKVQAASLRLTHSFHQHAATSALQRRPVGYYAGLLNVTPDHLTRVVKRVTGRTPKVWLQELVLLDAKRLLAFTGRPIERIAEDLQFSTATQFGQWFRLLTGQTPGQVRQGAQGRTSVFHQNERSAELPPAAVATYTSFQD